MSKAVDGLKAIKASWATFLCFIYLLPLGCGSSLGLEFARRYFIATYVNYQTIGQAERKMSPIFPDCCQGKEKAFSSQVLWIKCNILLFLFCGDVSFSGMLCPLLDLLASFYSSFFLIVWVIESILQRKSEQM